MRSERLQQWLLLAGLVISAVLLVRFAIDFGGEMRWWLSVPFSLLVAITLAVGISNTFRAGNHTDNRGDRTWKRVLLLAAIPLAFLASSLDCTGLSLRGCSPFCTFIKVVWIPLLTITCAAFIFVAKPFLLSAILAMSFIPLVPHCVCYNVGNGWWIDLIGASPLCYGWGFVVGIVAVGALRRRFHFWPSLVVSFGIISGATGFFVSHHYFHFPW